MERNKEKIVKLKKIKQVDNFKIKTKQVNSKMKISNKQSKKKIKKVTNIISKII